jgi:hypothetical protein
MTERLVERYSVRRERSKGTEKLGPRIFEGDCWSGAMMIVHQISASPLRRARERNARGRTGPPRPRALQSGTSAITVSMHPPELSSVSARCGVESAATTVVSSTTYRAVTVQENHQTDVGPPE